MSYKLYTQLVKKLDEYSTMIGKFEKREYDFYTPAVAWLSDCENIIKATKKGQASTLSSIKSSMLAVKNGVYPANMNFEESLTKRKKKNGAIAHLLSDAQGQVMHLTEQMQENIETTKATLKQMIVFLVKQGQFNQAQATAEDLWCQIERTPSFNEACTNLLTHMKRADCVLILTDVLQEWLEEQTPAEPIVKKPHLEKAG